MSRLAALIHIVAQVVTVAGVSPQTTADQLVKSGTELRKIGRDAEALAVLERALALDGTPRSRAQVGLAEQALGRWVEAERDLAGAMAKADDPWIERNRDALASSLAVVEARLSTFEAEVNVDGAILLVNGNVVGALPASSPVRMVAGTAVIEVRAAGYEPLQRTVSLVPATRSHEVFELTKIRAGDRKGLAPVVGAAGAHARAAADAPVARLPSSDSQRATAWITLGSAGALAGVAAVGAFVYDRNTAIYNNDGRCLYGDLSRDARCGSYRGAAVTGETLAIVGIGAAGALAATATVLFLTSRPPDAHRASIGCALDLALTCHATF